jgi:hypothetical protein
MIRWGVITAIIGAIAAIGTFIIESKKKNHDTVFTMAILN